MFKRIVATGLAASLAMPLLAAPPVVDGQSITSTVYGTALAVQRFQTGFGNDTDSGQFGFGNELDALFATNDADNLYIGLSGNQENNGNCVVVFIDVNGAGSGANFLFTTTIVGEPIPGLPRYLAGDSGGSRGFDNIQFDTNFGPDYAIGWSGGSPVGSQTRTYFLVNWTEFDPVSGGEDHTNEIAGLVTAGNPTASVATPGTLGSFLQTSSLGIRVSADNSNVDGVEGTSPPDFIPQLTGEDPLSATKGFEMAIPLSLLGVGVDDQVCLFAVVSSSNGYISNQLLPTDTTATTFTNIGDRNLGQTTLDFNTIAGDQFVCYTIVEPPGCPSGLPTDCDTDIVGNTPADPPNCMVDLTDLSVLLVNFGTGGNTFNDGDVHPAVLGGTPDGDVDLDDLSQMLVDFGRNCN